MKISNMNIQVHFPSETPGAIADIKKGRSTISFTKEEIQFAMGFFTLLAMTPGAQGGTPLLEEVVTREDL